eukprot:PhF_6_TR31272/c1_g1_i1/m.45815
MWFWNKVSETAQTITTQVQNVVADVTANAPTLEQDLERREVLSQALKEWKANYRSSRGKDASLHDLDSDEGMSLIWDEYREVNQRIQDRGEEQGEEQGNLREQVSSAFFGGLVAAQSLLNKGVETVVTVASNVKEFVAEQSSTSSRTEITIWDSSQPSMEGIAHYSTLMLEREDHASALELAFIRFTQSALENQIGNSAELTKINFDLRGISRDLNKIRDLIDRIPHEGSDVALAALQIGNHIERILVTIQTLQTNVTMYAEAISAGDFSLIAQASSKHLRTTLRLIDDQMRTSCDQNNALSNDEHVISHSHNKKHLQGGKESDHITGDASSQAERKRIEAESQ